MNKNLIFIMFIMALFSMALVLAQEQYNCPMGSGMMYGIYGGYGAGLSILSWITWLLLIALIIAAIYWLVKSASKKK